MSYIGNAPISAAFLTDTFSGNGSTTAFTMTVAPANTSSIIVAVTGVLQSPDTYSVSGTTLTFSAAPPTGTSNISVRYLGIPASGVTTTAYRTVTNTTATAGQTSFTIPSYTVGYVDVYRNGVYLPSADYTATTGTTVVLTNAATVGDTITTISFYVSSVLNAIPNSPASVSSSNLAALSTIPSTAGNITVPAVTGTMMVSGNQQGFSAYLSANQSISASTFTKAQFNTTEFNLGSAYDATTNYRFTPTVAGYYQVNLMIYLSGVASTQGNAFIYKNGANFKSASQVIASNQVIAVPAIIYMNGSTDYIEAYGYAGGGSSIVIAGGASSQYCYFQAMLIRNA
jgi:hypothetical protein